MNGENDKLIRDFMNAFEKKGVKVFEEFFHPNLVFRNYDHGRHQYPCEHRSGNPYHQWQFDRAYISAITGWEPATFGAVWPTFALPDTLEWPRNAKNPVPSLALVGPPSTGREYMG
jgi:hypothetical protein